MTSWVSSTGRGVPVDPDVNKMAASSVPQRAGAFSMGAARSAHADRSANDATCAPAPDRVGAWAEEASSRKTHETPACSHIEASAAKGMRGESGTVTARSHEAATNAM